MTRLWQPGRLRPMLAQQADGPFDSAEFSFEYKWDGYRALLFVNAGEVFIQSRNGKNLTPNFPELTGVGSALHSRRAILDCELVVWQGRRPDFSSLQRRVRGRIGGASLAAAKPAMLMTFDLLHADGEDVIHWPWEQRRERLRAMLDSGSQQVVFSESVVAQGIWLYDQAAANGLEGIMAKRRHSTYIPGQRSPAWLKIPRERRLACVIGGVLPGGHYSGIGSLLVGAYARRHEHELVYLGRVGSGLSAMVIKNLLPLLQPIDSCPFSEIPAGVQHAVWLDPQVACEVAYRELTPAGRLRHPVYKKLLPGVLPEQCTVPAGEFGDAASMPPEGARR